MSVVLVLILVSAMSLSVFATGSVVAPIIKEYEGGTATITQDTSGKYGDGDNIYTFVATAIPGYRFVGWKIDGNYEILSGSLKSKKITVRFLNDITVKDDTAIPLFKKIGGAEPTQKTTKKKTTSPKTSDNMAMVVLATAALAGVVISKKKLSK